MAQLGDLVRAKALLRRAARAFGPKEAVARARCVVAEAEIALVSRNLGWPSKALDTARATQRRMLKVFPQLADARIEFAWGGYVDITMSRAPDFNRLAPNVYYLQGFSGHGIALTGIAGQLVAEAIAGQAERFDVFTKLRHRKFPGGAALRMPALVLAMAWYRLRDLL